MSGGWSMFGNRPVNPSYPGVTGALEYVDASCTGASGFDVPRVIARQDGVQGYIAWSDGRIKQWGFYGGDATQDRVITFPVPFAQRLDHISMEVLATGTPANIILTAFPVGRSLTGFTGAVRFTNGSTVGRAGEGWTYQAEG